jgi:sugar-specific transcriptional regulator TrmB
MDTIDLEKLGLNRNEARVYYALIQKKEATAAEIIKITGAHRGIVYDNLERLIEKGLVSFVMKEGKKYFVAEEPDAIIEFLDSKKQAIDSEIKNARKLMPEIAKYLKAQAEEKSDARVFRGTKGLKKVLAEILTAKESWCIGMTNESVDVLSANYWENYNAKVNALKIKEHFLLNANYKDTYFFDKIKTVNYRRLPPELNQVTEIILYHNRIAMFIFTKIPTVVVIEDKNLFQTFKQQFDFLWKLSKP